MVENNNVPVQGEVELGTDIENTESTVNVTDNGNSKRSLIDQVIDVISDVVSKLVNPNQAGKVKSLVRDVLVTVFALCAADEYALGVRVDGELYRYSDYSAPVGVAKLLVAKRVVVRDVSTAKDYLARDKFKAVGKVLTPSDFAVAIKQIQAALRVNSNSSPLSRPEEALLSEAAQYAVTGGKVADRSQTCIYFVSIISDDEARVAVKEWAKTVALSLFN